MRINFSKKNLLVICFGGIMAVTFFIMPSNKQVYLYAWERSEDFSFLENDKNTAIVFYAGDIVIKNGKAVTNLRRNSLNIPEEIKSFPLIRIDSFDSPNDLFTNSELIADFVIKICGGFEECQLDFEARTSEYEFYRSVLDKVRDTMPNKKISVTALASWCSGDTFINDLPANVAVPMLYRMGKDSAKIKKEAVGKWFLSNSKCSDSIALSVDELDFDPRRYMRGKSVYLFNPEPWTRDSYKKTLSHLGL